MTRLLLAALLCAALTACASGSGPGVECDPCGEVPEDLLPERNSAEARASASGDVDLTNQPKMIKPLPVNADVIQNRGSGPLTAETATKTTDAVTGAPNVFQCLFGTTPTAQAQSQASQAVAEWKAYLGSLRAYRDDVARCQTMPAHERQCALKETDERIVATTERIESAERVIAQGGPQLCYYDLSGDITVVQIAASGSSSNEPGKGALDPETQQEVAKQTPKALQAVMGKGESAKPDDERTSAEKVAAARALGRPKPCEPTPPAVPLPKPDTLGDPMPALRTPPAEEVAPR